MIQKHLDNMVKVFSNLIRAQGLKFNFGNAVELKLLKKNFAAYCGLKPFEGLVAEILVYIKKMLI